MESKRLLVSPLEAAETLGCSRSMVYELMASGRLDSVRMGRLRRVPVVALEEFVDGLSDEATPSHDAYGIGSPDHSISRGPVMRDCSVCHRYDEQGHWPRGSYHCRTCHLTWVPGGEGCDCGG
jgi:excisionase family DNA binding protein